MTRAGAHRKHIPIGVKLRACLLLLGFTEAEVDAEGGIQWDHTPPLALRFVDPETGELTPHPNDPRHIQPLRRETHARKTNGAPACAADGDIHKIAKAKRLEKQTEEFRARLTAADKGRAEPERARKIKRQWPKRRLDSRGHKDFPA